MIAYRVLCACVPLSLLLCWLGHRCCKCLVSPQVSDGVAILYQNPEVKRSKFEVIRFLPSWIHAVGSKQGLKRREGGKEREKNMRADTG